MKFKSSVKTSRFLFKRLQYLYRHQPPVSNASQLASAFTYKPIRGFNFMLKNKGLFKFPELTSPEGFKILEARCFQEVNDLVTEACDPNRKRKMVTIFDDMSDSICRVADMVEFIKSAHPDPIYRDAAEQTCLNMSELVERLNTHIALYEALKVAVDEGDVLPLTDVDLRVLKLFKHDFEQCGIHFEEEKRQRFVAINNELLRISNNFMHASHQPTPTLNLLGKDEELSGYLNKISANSKYEILHGLGSRHANERIREAVYRIYQAPNDHTETLLHDMLEARYLISQITGFESFAHRALRGTLAGSPENVMKFLKTLAQNLKTGADAEYEFMKKIKYQDSNSVFVAPWNSEIMPWDPAYFAHKCRGEMFQYESVKRHFSLGSCMEGLSTLFECLYDIRLDCIDQDPGEAWSDDIYKLAVVHNTEGLLGYIYCDFFTRTNKLNQDCHFTTQGGRMKNNGEYQLPVVVVHLNFRTGNPLSPPLLSPAQVENLFHEFGHAMHSMLGRTQYQHVSGTRCPLDMAEIPALLMEYFMADPRVVKMYAKDYVTGADLPDNQLMNFCRSRRLFLYSELQQQVVQGITDQIFHGPDFFPINKTSTQVAEEIQNQYGIPYVENTAWQLRFSHLVGYGASYYSYLMSRAVASRIWNQLFMKDPFCRESGEKYRRLFLAHGGERPPKELIENLLGEEPTIDMLTSSLTEDLKQRSVVP
ncbi:hypothetical protein ACF0H5_020821 [Mactra antiquata]